MPENLGQKGLTEVVKICINITPDFVSKGQKDVKRGYYGVKMGCQNKAGCIPALADVESGYFRSWRDVVDDLLAGDLQREASWARAGEALEEWVGQARSSWGRALRKRG
jgi:hypothetical protein